MHEVISITLLRQNLSLEQYKTEIMHEFKKMHYLDEFLRVESFILDLSQTGIDPNFLN